MARIRTIKPEFWEDEKMESIPLPARLLFIGTWNFADDFGVIINSVKYIKSKIFPYDDSLRESNIKTWLDSLINAQMLVPFEYKNKSYLVIRTFKRHQLIDKRYTKSILPDSISVDEILAGLDLDKITTLTHSEHIVNTPLYSNSKVKDSNSKVSVKEKKSFFENVNLTKKEFENLKNEFTEEITNDAIKFLSDYKTEKGYKTRDDNLTIRRWVINAVKEKKEKSSAKKESLIKTLTKNNDSTNSKIEQLFGNQKESGD